MPARTYTFDALMELHGPGVGATGFPAITSLGPGLSAGAPKILDLGGAQVDGMAVINVAAIKVSSGDERYQIVIQGSTSPSFASGIENLATLDLGATAVRAAGARSNGPGMHFVGVCNEAEDVVYRYLRIYNVLSGTSPSIAYHAWLSNPAGH